MRVGRTKLHARNLAPGLLCAASLALASVGAAQSDDAGASPHAGHEGGSHMQHGGQMQHGDHNRSEPGYTRSVRHVRVPDLSLQSARSGEVSLRNVVEGDGLLLLNFIFTSCTTICPVLTATFSATRDQLDALGQSYRMVSISIDPEHDTPGRLAEYAKRHGLEPEWRFLTGDQASITSVQKAFDVYRGNKMNHIPVAYLRGSRTGAWLRIDGFPSASDLAREAQQLAVK